MMEKYFVILTVLLLIGSAEIYAIDVPTPTAPELKAKSYLLADFNSGQLIVEKNPDERIEPASITKLMTAYIIYLALADGSIKKTDLVNISEKAWRMEGSRMFVEVGKQITVEELMRGVIIQSGNDATVALAEHIAGTENAFAQIMNAQAKSLGMTGSNFTNSTGWPDENHYMTARDIYILSRAIIRDFPEHYKMYKEKEFTFNNIPQYNRNKLLWQDASVDGLKTGHTESAGYCLVASAARNNMRLISVVIGADSEKSRAEQSKALLNYGFRFFETRPLYKAGQPLAEIRAWKGEPKNLSLGLSEDLSITFPKGKYEQLDASMDRPESIEAPVLAGQEIGKVSIKLDGVTLLEKPLTALVEVKQGSLWRRLIDTVLQFFA
ncbi:MAG TPA: D-alanyl-D-alanine carboxypeptidase [Chromatiales bacterium]|nr:D-alanyl-D-alanine carboxypeptidase [Thiotrichales bacterium]HIP68573.1 D-alanyl-D-alanine carboxypeptidase [Chromatiales bacterium]